MVGANGSGKSVLFKIICGFEKPDQGSVYVRGRQIGKNGRDFPADMGRSEEHTSELQSLMRISYAVFCLKKGVPLCASGSCT